MSATALTDRLARYMDLKPFAAKRVGKEQAEKLAVRRDIAKNRAKAAIRFFLMPENRAALDALITERSKQEQST